jgi:dTDP-glucose 4,6-dehydratase
VIYLLQHTDWDLVSVDKITYAGSLLNVPQVKRHKLYIGDICDYHFVEKVFEIEKPDVVIQGAAESHVDNSIISPTDFIRTNVIGTHSVLEAARKIHMPKRFINYSTDEVYGSVEKGHSKETDQFAARSPYSSSKAAADILGNSYFVTYGVPVITIRSCNVFGPRQHVEKFIPKSITNIFTKNKIPLYGTGQNIRDWIYIKDHFFALMAVLEKGIPGEAYNISAECEKSNIDVLNTIFDIMGEGKDLLEHVKDRPGHDKRYSVDCSKLKALGWQAQYNFEDALRHTIGWYKSNMSWFCRGNKWQTLQKKC